MERETSREKPTLVLNRGTEDADACRRIMTAGIPCELVAGSADVVTPTVLFGQDEFVGLSEIERFIRIWLRASESQD